MSETTKQSYDKTAEAYAAMNGAAHPEKNGKKFLELLPLLPRGAKVLDVGCGPGRDAKIFSEAGLDVTGIDFSQEMIALAKLAAPKASFHVMDVLKIGLAPESFDGVWASASLLHISKADLPMALKGIRGVLKPGGVFYLSVKQGEGETVEKDGRFEGAEKFWAYYSAEELKKVVEEAGFSVVECSVIEKRKTNQTHPYIDVFCKKMENAVEIVELDKKYYIGLELRTTNQEGQSHTEIPRHWQRFFMEDFIGKIPGKIGGMLAHYTDYAGDWMQPYTMASGFEVSSLDEVPEGLVGREVPAAKYAVYTAKGKFPDALLKVWQEIWSSDLNRAYKSDFEMYPEDFDPAGNPEIKVYISINDPM